MIQYALLFGLGFLTALLIGLLIAPAIHRRIVVFTENRIRATVPISAGEVRAQRDMARAVYAAENARNKQELLQERDKSVALQLKGEELLNEIKNLVAEGLEMKTRLDEMDTTGADLRSKIRQDEGTIIEIKAALEASEEVVARRDNEIDDLKQQLDVLSTNNDNARIDLSSRDTEIENLKFRINDLRHERERLRQDVHQLTLRAKDGEARLLQEEQRIARLEEMLAKGSSELADREAALDRRREEVARLRDGLNVGGEPGTPTLAKSPQAVVEPELLVPSLAAGSPTSSVTAGEGPDARVAALGENARNRATAFSERLLNSKSGSNDNALRQELAAIAADMVAMTALSEGPISPIHALTAGKTADRSLATRVKTLLDDTKASTDR